MGKNAGSGRSGLAQLETVISSAHLWGPLLADGWAEQWKTIPSWAVVGTADRDIPPAVQLAMARHAHAHITEVRAPHLSMISDPGVVTRVILKAVHATG